MRYSGSGPASSSNVMCDSALPSSQGEAADGATYRAHAMPSAVWFVVATASSRCRTSCSGSQLSSECPATTAADTAVSYGSYDTCEVEHVLIAEWVRLLHLPTESPPPCRRHRRYTLPWEPRRRPGCRIWLCARGGHPQIGTQLHDEVQCKPVVGPPEER